MLNSGTSGLYQILMMGKISNGQEGLEFKEKGSETEPPVSINATLTNRNHHHKGGKKKHSSRKQKI